MKKLLQIALLISLLSVPAVTLALDIQGVWQGQLTAARYDPITLILRIQSNDDGSYQATLDIPSQFRANLPVDQIRVTGSSILIRLSSVQAEYYGTLSIANDGINVTSMDGDWNQSGEYIPLQFHRYVEE